MTGFFPVVTRTPDPVTGYTPYLSTALNPFGQLAAWQTAGVVVDGLYEIRLEMVDAALNPLGVTDWHTVRVDNTEPDADITFTSGTSCNKATPGDIVQGTFKATDPFFGSYSMNTLPASLAPPNPTHTPAVDHRPGSLGNLAAGHRRHLATVRVRRPAVGLRPVDREQRAVAEERRVRRRRVLPGPVAPGSAAGVLNEGHPLRTRVGSHT